MKRSLKSAIAAGLLGMAGHAAALTLPGVNPMSVGQYGDFYVYSLDLLKSCVVSDSRCQPFIGDPPQLNEIDSSAGKVGGNIVIYADASGNQLPNYDNATGPFPGQNPALVQVDNNFQPPTGSTGTFDMAPGGEPAEIFGNGQDSEVDWDGDVAGRWDAKLSSIVSFLGDADLVFLFDNNQVGTDLSQQQFFWARLDILDGPAGGVVASYCLTSAHTFGVFDPNSNACSATFQEYTDFLNPGSFVGSGGRFCVDKTTGASFLPGGGAAPPSNEGDCTAENGYFVSNNLGASSAEFAAFVPDLNENLLAWADAGYFMQIDFKMRGLNNGGEKLWIAGVEITDTPDEPVPAPGTLALMALGLLGAAAGSRRLRKA